MKEYTKIKINNQGYKFSNEEKIKLKFGNKHYEIVFGEILDISDNILVITTQSYYDGVPLKLNNINSKFELFKESNIKICGGVVLCKYYEPASKNTWKTKEINLEQAKEFPIELSFTDKEKELISFGITPLSMDDKWFMFVENNTIKYIRSWTGNEIFRAKFEKEGENWKINSVLVSPLINVPDEEKVAVFKELISYRAKTLKELTS